jgi:pilus assembly protein Flp/PilA
MLGTDASSRSAAALVSRFLRHEGGATAIEYGLIAAMLSVALVAAALILGGSLDSLWNYIETEIIAALT